MVSSTDRPPHLASCQEGGGKHIDLCSIEKFLGLYTIDDPSLPPETSQSRHAKHVAYGPAHSRCPGMEDIVSDLITI